MIKIEQILRNVDTDFNSSINSIRLMYSTSALSAEEKKTILLRIQKYVKLMDAEVERLLK